MDGSRGDRQLIRYAFRDEPEKQRRLYASAYNRVRTVVARAKKTLLKRTFGFDVLTCPCCSGKMKLPWRP